MFSVQSRSALVVIVFLLLGGLAPITAYAQTENDQQPFIDTMDGESPPLLTEETADPSQVVYRYALGQYTIQAFDPEFTGDLLSFVNVGPFTDSRTAVDAIVDLSGAGQQNLLVGCRAADDHNGYALQLQPATSTLSLWRLDAAEAVELASADASDIVNAGDAFDRLEIECVADAISGALNGVDALSASDSTYDAGTSFIGAGNNVDSPGTIFAAFDNLEIVDLTAAQPEPPAEEETAEDAPAEATPSADEPAEEESAEPVAGVDPATLEAAVIDYALATGPIAGPFVEDVMLTNNALRVLPAGVDVGDLHTEVRFVVPVDALPGTWSIGFCLWVDAEGGCYDVFVHSDGTSAGWIYAHALPSGESEILDEGPITGLDLTPGASNFIGVSAVGNTGVMIVNSAAPAASFTIVSPGETGDVTRWLSFEAADPEDTRSFTMSTDEFSVWDLSGMPPVAGVEPPDEASETEATEEPAETPEPEATEEPAETPEPEATEEPTETPEAEATEEVAGADESEATAEADAPEATAVADGPDETDEPSSTDGSDDPADTENPLDAELGEQVAGPLEDVLIESDTTIEPFLANVDIADFYTTVDVVVPLESTVPWDFTIGFRDFGENDQYRLTFVSDGTWTLAYGDEDPFDSGEIDNLLTVPGEVNRFELVADGDGGEFAVNGVRITSVFLTEVLDSGDLWVATAANFQTTEVGRSTEFRDFRIYELA